MIGCRGGGPGRSPVWGPPFCASSTTARSANANRQPSTRSTAVTVCGQRWPGCTEGLMGTDFRMRTRRGGGSRHPDWACAPMWKWGCHCVRLCICVFAGKMLLPPQLGHLGTTKRTVGRDMSEHPAHQIAFPGGGEERRCIGCIGRPPQNAAPPPPHSVSGVPVQLWAGDALPELVRPEAPYGGGGRRWAGDRVGAGGPWPSEPGCPSTLPSTNGSIG